VIVLPQERAPAPKDAGGGKDQFKLWKRVAAPVLVAVLLAVVLPKLGGGPGRNDSPPPAPPPAKAADPTPAPAATPPAQQTAVKVCPKCGAPMTVKKGRYGKFWSCSRFPDCHGSTDYP
jgi:hypothetical protein